MSRLPRLIALAPVFACAIGFQTTLPSAATPAVRRDPGAESRAPGVLVGTELDSRLTTLLTTHGFTGRVEQSLEDRLGRRIDRRRADLGRLLWFDTVTGLHDDNSCGGCHSPTNGFGDTQSIAIGIDNNAIVGPDRAGPRNQRRSPIAINTAFYPALMWNGRFSALSGDPFDPSAGFKFTPPEGLTLSYLPHLLAAQAFIPPSERNEVAGFDFPGDNFAIRAEVMNRLNATPAYRKLFAQAFADLRGGAPITFDHFGQAIAEFEFSLTFTDTPLDRFARGERDAMSAGEKRGAVVFLDRAGCVSCHAVSGPSNEMFSDFRMHVIGVPQVVPAVTNSVFDGPGQDEDFGLEQVTGNPTDRYAFRTSPLRNLAMQPAFMHNGCFTTIEDAVRHHLDAFASARGYSPRLLDEDLQGAIGPIEPVLARIDPLLSAPIALSESEFEDLVLFLRWGLLDPRAGYDHLARLIPRKVPSGRSVMIFQAPEADFLAARPADVRDLLDARAATAGVAAVRSGRTALLPPRPNPSAGEVVTSLELSGSERVSAQVVDATGRLVRTLEAGAWRGAGAHPLRWDGRDMAGRRVSPGAYFVRARVGGAILHQRVVRV